MKIKDFIEHYCLAYSIEEDDFSSEDVIYIEDCFYLYCTTGILPDFMRFH